MTATTIDHYVCPTLPDPLVEVLEQLTADLRWDDVRLSLRTALFPPTKQARAESRGEFYAALFERTYVQALYLARHHADDLAGVHAHVDTAAHERRMHEQGDLTCCDQERCRCHASPIPTGEPCARCTAEVVEREHDALQGYLALIARHVAAADADQLIALGHAAETAARR